jgi:type VI secretion system secreted protein VgrG
MSMDDTKGAEKITIHGQRDLESTIENDERASVLKNRTRSVGENESVDIGIDRTSTIGANDSGVVGAIRDWVVRGADKLLVRGERTEEMLLGLEQTVGTKHTLNVVGPSEVRVGADRYVMVEGSVVETVGTEWSVDAGNQVEITTGDGAASLLFKKDGTIEIVGKHIVLKAGAGKVEIDRGGNVLINGSLVKINC